MSKFELLHVGSREMIKTDLSGCSIDEIHETIGAFDAFVEGKDLGAMVFLTNVEGVIFDQEVIRAFKVLLDRNKDKISISVFCGLSQMQKIVLKGIGEVSDRTFMYFDTEQDAMNYIENVL